MKKAIAVLNIGGRSLSVKAKHSFRTAAYNWGCDLVEIRDPLKEGVHHFWQKTFVCDHLEKYDRVVQLDADMMIRWDCPSPFDLVPVDSFGVVSARQFENGPIIHHRQKCVGHWAKVMGMQACPDEKHLNGGFFLYSPKHHSKLWAECRAVGESQGFTSKFLPEQASMSVLLWNKKCPQTWLPHTFNAVGAATYFRPQLTTWRMNDYIYHFTGQERRQKRINGVDWWKQECDECSSRIPDGGTFCEVGVWRGDNACNVLARANIGTLILVDTWGKHLPSYSKENDLYGGLAQSVYDANYARAMHLVSQYPVDELRVLNSLSTEAAKKVADESCDVVFIDADHTYDAVKADIEAWMPKVKPGGWLGGHDYKAPPKWAAKWGVKQAVDERFGKRASPGEGKTWWVKI